MTFTADEWEVVLLSLKVSAVAVGLTIPVAGQTAPFGVDQPYHAGRIHSLGVGPAPVRMSRLTARRLAGLLDASGLIGSAEGRAGTRRPRPRC